MQQACLGALIIGVFIAGCAHNSTRGAVVGKEKNLLAIVTLGANVVRPGDRVIFYQDVCMESDETITLGQPSENCFQVELGDGTIARSIDKKYSIVKVNPGTLFDKGTKVEKSSNRSG